MLKENIFFDIIFLPQVDVAPLLWKKDLGLIQFLSFLSINGLRLI
jgi:hypothetical protein